MLDTAATTINPTKTAARCICPGEIKPLLPLSPESLHVRKADEPYDPFPALRPSAERIAEINSWIEAAANDGETDERTLKLMQSVAEPRLTTKRERWKDVPSELRKLSGEVGRF